MYSPQFIRPQTAAIREIHSRIAAVCGLKDCGHDITINQATRLTLSPP